LQLFTENTITAVLPLLADRTGRNLYLTARLWAVVFGANLVGTFGFALAATYGGIFPVDQLEPFLEISRHFMAKSPSEMLLHGIPAGFLIAVMVWMIPSAEGAGLWVVTMATYLIALGDLTHVVAGSTEAFLLLVNGEIGIWKTVGGFLVPTFVGNVIGGTVLFTLLAYGQVREEI
jgi:formate/nitrite transporter FocA (FNT family)